MVSLALFLATLVNGPAACECECSVDAKGKWTIDATACESDTDATRAAYRRRYPEQFACTDADRAMRANPNPRTIAAARLACRPEEMRVGLDWAAFLGAVATDAAWLDSFAATAEEAHSMSLGEIPGDDDQHFSPDCSR